MSEILNCSSHAHCVPVMHTVFWDESVGITVQEFVHIWQPWHKAGVTFTVLSYNWSITVFTPKYGCYKTNIIWWLSMVWKILWSGAGQVLMRTVGLF